MYANGWVIETVNDQTQVKFVTEFEKDLPLRNISLVEYERRLKKLVTREKWAEDAKHFTQPFGGKAPRIFWLFFHRLLIRPTKLGQSLSEFPKL